MPHITLTFSFDASDDAAIEFQKLFIDKVPDRDKVLRLIKKYAPKDELYLSSLSIDHKDGRRLAGDLSITFTPSFESQLSYYSDSEDSKDNE